MNKETKIDSKSLEERVSFLEGKTEVFINQTNERLRGIESEISSLRSETKNEINSLRNEMKNEIKELNNKIDNQFKWLIGLIVVSWLIPILLRFLFH
ncbi:MAG: hypothetical protein ACPLRT_06575 [Thermoproteota archaeon]